MTRRVRRRGGGDQALGRHTANIEAVAAHLPPLDQHDRGAKLGRAGGDAETARARANDAEIARSGSEASRGAPGRPVVLPPLGLSVVHPVRHNSRGITSA